MKNGFIAFYIREKIENYRKRLRISEDRAIEIEDIALDFKIHNLRKLKNDFERDYYKSYIKNLRDGIISDDARAYLNEKKDKLGISDKRALKIESLCKINSIILKQTKKKIKKKELYCENDSFISKWRSLGSINFLFFHIFNIIVILCFEVYFFIRIKEVLNIPEPVRANSRFQQFVNDSVNFIKNMIPSSIERGANIFDHVLFNAILILLFIAFFIVLFILYTYSSRVLSVMIGHNSKQVSYFYKAIAILFPISFSFVMFILPSGIILEIKELLKLLKVRIVN